MLTFKKRSSLFGALCCLTALTVFAQLSFFFVHYKLTDLIDSLANSSIFPALSYPVILTPLLTFVGIQICAYLLFVIYAWFITVSVGRYFNCSKNQIYYLGLLTWVFAISALFALNSYYYPRSFFAFSSIATKFVMTISCGYLTLMTLVAWIEWLKTRKPFLAGSILLLMLGLMVANIFYEKYLLTFKSNPKDHDFNIIIIGIDSLRPDFTGFYGNDHINTPHVDAFLRNATTSTNAYTLLARTFPSWVTILTSQYPKHNQARMNLADPKFIVTNDTLARHLKDAGYETIYATDEARFADINEQYGFDEILGSKGGAAEFLIGGLSDFPLTNLLLKLPLSSWLLPYNYGNRGADITYDPKQFLHLVEMKLAKRSDKPLFLAMHLCLAHWPFSYAKDKIPENAIFPERYQKSVEAVDQQFGELMAILQSNTLLSKSLVVVLSDHGVTLGMPNDRLIRYENYQGVQADLKFINRYRLSTASEYTFDFAHDFILDTSYGQGTDVLSMKQYQIVLGMRIYGEPSTGHTIEPRVSLLDVTPTILDFLHLKALKKQEGASLLPYLQGQNSETFPARPLFFETGDSIGDLETDNIHIENVVRKTINAYEINPKNGTLLLNERASLSIIKVKQRALLMKDWLLARYPSQARLKLVRESEKISKLVPYDLPPHWVLINIKTGKWTVGLKSPLAKTAPLDDLLQTFMGFYGDEVTLGLQ